MTPHLIPVWPDDENTLHPPVDLAALLLTDPVGDAQAAVLMQARRVVDAYRIERASPRLLLDRLDALAAALDALDAALRGGRP